MSNKEAKRESIKTLLIDDLKTIADHLQKTPSTSDLKLYSKFSPKTYYNYFGTLRNAQIAVGIEPNNIGNGISHSELEKRIHSCIEKSKKIGRTLSMNEVREIGVKSYSHYKKYMKMGLELGLKHH